VISVRPCGEPTRLDAWQWRFGVRSDIEQFFRFEVVDTRQPPSIKPIAEGALARATGAPIDACPYPLNSAEHTAWLEGYDGTPAEDHSDLPEADA
jgi:hypothetical protein